MKTEKISKYALYGVIGMMVFVYVIVPFLPHQLFVPPLDSDTAELYIDWSTEYIESGDPENAKTVIAGLDSHNIDTRNLKIYYEQNFGDTEW